MAGEIWLALAAACVVGTIALPVAVRHVRKLRDVRAYPARHTAEQPAVEHVGVTETSPRLRDLPLAPPVPPIDPRILLAEARAERVRINRRIAELEARIEAEENDRLHQSLERLELHFKDQLARAGQREITTHEWTRADIRRVLTAAHRGVAR